MQHNYNHKHNNVEIRPLKESDIELLRVWRNTPTNTKYLRPIGFISQEMQKKWFANELVDPRSLTFAIDETVELNRCVGSLALYNIKEDEAEFGRILIGDTEAHGRQVGVNSVIAACQLAFSVLKLQRVYLHVYSENLAAIRIYKKAGFKTVIDQSELYMEVRRDEWDFI